MIELGSLVGFALLFVVTTWLASAVVCAALVRAHGRLRALGPRAERRAAVIALALPVTLGATLTAGLAAFSVLGPSFGVADHCATHDLHLHLCLRHGASWLTRWWAVALTAGVGGLFAARLGRALHQWWGIAGRLRALRAVSAEHAICDGTIVLRAPSRQPFCFTSGIRTPRIYIGSATLDRLDDDQQRAVVAHEHAHVAFGDLWRNGVLSTLALLGAPAVAAAALQIWRDAGERLCDRVAADTVGSPATVASAILAFARAPAHATGCSFVPLPEQIADRVEAVLANADTGERAARRLGVGASAVFLAIAGVGVVLADSLHHAFEILLGTL